MADERKLRAEIRSLGELLGTVLREQAGDEAFEHVEQVRALAKQRRSGDEAAERSLRDLVASLDEGQLAGTVQALSVFFDLANLAEDRHRVRVIRERQRGARTAGIESIDSAIAMFRKSGMEADDVQRLLDRLAVEFVFTAHPTEAKRRSIREKVRDMREDLRQLDDPLLTPRERRRLNQRLRGDLTAMWQTNFVRFRRPTVLEELDRSLFFAGNLWRVTPRLYRELRDALAEHFPDASFTIPPLLRFGTWIGGDRDGNPNVTADVTRSALLTLRANALRRHIEQASLTRRALSMSTNKTGVSDELVAAFEGACERWPMLRQRTQHLSESEPYRRFLHVVQWRLEQAAQAKPLEQPPDGAYANSGEFADDLRLIRESLRANRGESIAEAHLDDWICQADVFGFHLMRLDVRQESTWYHEVMAEVLGHLGVSNDYAHLDETNRQRVLSDSMPCTQAIDASQLSEQAQETVSLFRLLASVCAMSGPKGLGAHVISMTHQPSDVLAVLWLCQWASHQEGLPDGRLPMPISPLFETIDDLKHAPQTIEAMLSNKAYVEHVRALDNKQVVMIGYSDSTKDGGYLAACWYLNDAQVAIERVTSQHDIDVVFFHGRGGSLGRGGGPAARSIISLPPETLRSGMRITEQGEVLAERYDDPEIAHRHLEQVLGATLAWASQAGVQRDKEETQSRLEVVAEMAETSRRVYRQLVDRSGFIAYFEQVTPIEQIEQLPIGSRPSRRAGERSLEKLRAIPWVFSWTQCRHMIPAWYGLGSALSEQMKTPAGRSQMKTLYANDPFFRATIDNAELALAKADMGIAHVHACLAEDAQVREAIWSDIREEYERSRKAVLGLTGKRQLLANVPWLKRSIDVRNPYVDPLNFIQVELFRRLRSLPEDDPTHARVAAIIRLSIQGIAGGLRTTG